MGIVGLKSPPSKPKKIPPKEHILLPVLEAWKDARFKKYKKKTTLERWTIDRHDTESGVVRIERVSAQKTLEELADELSSPDTDLPDFDSLEWWDADSARNEHIDAGKLADILNLTNAIRGESIEDKILENAVYMVLVHTKVDKKGIVTETVVNSFSFTTYARSLAKKLYEKLIFGKNQKKGAP